MGKLKVLRKSKHLPYKVAHSIGDRKRIEAQVFVRHGSQIEAATESELFLARTLARINSRAR